VKALLLILGLYSGSLLVLRYNISDLFSEHRGDIWVGYLTLVVAGMLLAEVLRRFTNPIPQPFRLPGMMALVVGFLIVLQYGPFWMARAGWLPPVAAVAMTPGEAVLRPGWDGHYRALTTLGQSDVGMLVDTGASLVLLRYEDAASAGLAMDSLDFRLPVTTAGSQSMVAPVVLDVVTIGGVMVRNVRGAVAAPGMLHTSLLGMSFLEKLRETVIRKNEMILRQ
jgi:aspartyl protease family protein